MYVAQRMDSRYASPDRDRTAQGLEQGRTIVRSVRESKLEHFRHLTATLIPVGGLDGRCRHHKGQQQEYVHAHIRRTCPHTVKIRLWLIAVPTATG